MANDLNTTRGDRPQNNNYHSNEHKQQDYKGNGYSASQKAFDSSIKTGKKTAKGINKALDKSALRLGRKAEKGMKVVNDNIFKGLTPEEHRKALIQSCVNTDNIFNDHLTDPPEKASDDFKDYMFYNQLYFLAAAQIMEPDETGSLLPGIVGGLSMIAGAALISDDFRKNLTQHIEDKLLQYVEPFKESAPKLWQQLSAHVESHPGCASPESVALKLLRYQKQAADHVSEGSLTSKEADDLLCKKVAELKAASDEVNISWDDVVSRRNQMAKDLDGMESWGAEMKNELCSKCDGLAEKTGMYENNWRTAKSWSAPVDVDSVAERLMSYQDQMYDISKSLAAGVPIGNKYKEFAGLNEAQCLTKMLDETAQLQRFATKTLNLKWEDVTDRYDKMNREKYDRLRDTKKSYYSFIDPPNQHKYLENGQLNEHFGEPNDRYRALEAKRKEMLRQQELTGKIVDNIPFVPKLKDGKIQGLIEADNAIREHNKRMYYELPVDANSAGRCLKKYQQEAYNSVRGAHDRVHDYAKNESIDSTMAYNIANDMCKNVKVASDALGFDWKDAIKGYRKDVYYSILEHPNKSSIWKEIVDDDVIANIPTSTTSYVTENGVTKKKITPLNHRQAIDAWDGVIYNSDGSRVDDNSLMRVRNPFTEDEASQALYGLFMDDFKLKLQKTTIEEEHGMKANGSDSVTFKDPKYQRQVDAINDEIDNVSKKRDNLVKAFTSDKFDASLIEKIQEKAMSWFEETKSQMASGKTDSKQTENVTLDESLAPSSDENEQPLLPLSPEF